MLHTDWEKVRRVYVCDERQHINCLPELCSTRSLHYRRLHTDVYRAKNFSPGPPRTSNGRYSYRRERATRRLSTLFSVPSCASPDTTIGVTRSVKTGRARKIRWKKKTPQNLKSIKNTAGCLWRRDENSIAAFRPNARKKFARRANKPTEREMKRKISLFFRDGWEEIAKMRRFKATE